MKRSVGVVGLGDMGLAMASNLLKAGFAVGGCDLRAEPLSGLEAAGGRAFDSPRALGAASDAVFVMVMNGAQVKETVLGEMGLIASLKPGSTVIVTATVMPADVRDLAGPLDERDIHLVDTPVSGGKAGAEAGTLTLMAAATAESLADIREVLEAVSAKVFHVGEEIGQGQIVKAATQALMGATYTATFEALVLGAKAGIKGQVLHDVIGASFVSSPAFLASSRFVMDREFVGTGAQIKTMYKDLGITLDLAREVGAAMFTTAAAHALFQSGICLFPDEDNWSVAKLLEQIAGTEVTR